MNCRQARNLIGWSDGRVWPEDARRHVQECAECRSFSESMSRVRDLIAVKRHETPDAGFENRCAEKIRLGLKSPEATRSESPAWSPAFFLRIAAAAALVLMVGLHIQSVRLTPLASAPGAAHAIVPGDNLFAPARFALPAARPAAPVIMLAQSNNGPDAIQYGPLPSRVVNWEY